METNPFSAERKTSERKRLWETIARSLVKRKSPKFKTLLSERSVRRRYMRITQGFKTKLNEEINACGISAEPSELDVLLEERRRNGRGGEMSTREKIRERSRQGERYSVKSHGKTVSNKTRKSLEMTRPKRVAEQAARLTVSWGKKTTRNGFLTRGTQIEEQGVRRRKKKVRRSREKTRQYDANVCTAESANAFVYLKTGW